MGSVTQIVIDFDSCFERNKFDEFVDYLFIYLAFGVSRSAADCLLLLFWCVTIRRQRRNIFFFFFEKKARNNDAWRWNISPSNRINLCMFGQVRRSSRCWIAVVHAVGYFHWISSVCFQFWTNFIFNTHMLSELRLFLRKSHEPKNEKCDAFHIYSEIKIRLVSLN